MGNLDNIPVSLFFDFYKSRPKWYQYINHEESSFLKLMQLDSLFIAKSIKSVEKTSPPKKKEVLSRPESP